MTQAINKYDSQSRRHGVWEHYHSDGTLWVRSHWLHGVLHGLWEDYRTDGTPYTKRYHLQIR